MPQTINLRETRTRLAAEQGQLRTQLLSVDQKLAAIDVLMGMEAISPDLADTIAHAADMDLDDTNKGRRQLNYKGLVLEALGHGQALTAKETTTAIRERHPELDPNDKTIDSTIAATLSKMAQRKELDKDAGSGQEPMRWSLPRTPS